MLRIFRVVGAVPNFGSKSDLVFNKRFYLVRESSCPGEWAHCLGLSPRFPWRFYRIIINCLWGSGRDYGEEQPASPLVGCGSDARRLLPRAIKGPPAFRFGALPLISPLRSRSRF